MLLHGDRLVKPILHETRTLLISNLFTFHDLDIIKKKMYKSIIR